MGEVSGQKLDDVVKGELVLLPVAEKDNLFDAATMTERMQNMRTVASVEEANTLAHQWEKLSLIHI